MIELYTEEFQQAIEHYQNSAEDPKVKALNIRGHQSWEEVIQKARDAEAEYLTAGTGRMRKFGRAATDRSAALLPLVRLLPNDSFCSAISGGLRLVVELSMPFKQRGNELTFRTGCLEDQREEARGPQVAPTYSLCYHPSR